MASSLFTVCPHCQKKTKIKDPGLNGKKARCPQCEQPFQIKLRKAKPRPAAVEPKPVAAASDDDWMSTLDEFQESGDGFSAGEFAEPPPRVGANASYYSEANDAGTASEKPKKKKKKSSRSSSGGFGLGPLGWVLGGGIAGVIGALIWGGITYASGYEVGWIAWGIGGMVGFGVLLGAGSDAGQASGLVAIAISVVSIALGKFFAVWMMISALVASMGDLVQQTSSTESLMISEVADEIVDQRDAAGIAMTFPEYDENVEVDLENYDYSRDYPADVWQEATVKWNGLTPAEKTARKEELDGQMGEVSTAAIMGDIGFAAVTESLGPFDILWVLLAGATAFRVGSNDTED